MKRPSSSSQDLISPLGYGIILSSPRLRRAILPGGWVTSPYEVLDYVSQLTLEDTRGLYAVFDRSQRVRFTHNGVTAILDHAWGDGVYISNYHNTAGALQDNIRDRGRRHLVIGLKRAMPKGAEFRFDVSRRVIAGFTRDDEWVETIIDHPAERLHRSIVFPKDRPCLKAELDIGGQKAPLEIKKQKDGRTCVAFTVAHARAHTPYTVRWSW